ncbi:MAG: hypothetical protein KUG77_10535 [Nannocystaceae bacterium]|nr:hypothetical protein [Nannocystaceae bacterium]
MKGRYVRWGLASLLGCGCSVGDFDEGVTFGDPNTLPSEDERPATGGAVLTTGVTDNPTGSDGDDGSETGAAMGTSGTDSASTSDSDAGPTSGGSTGAIAECGNGVVEADEVCDGDVGEMTCAELGTFVGGTLLCDAACSFDTSGCMELPKEPVEVCETISLPIPDLGAAVTSTVSLPDGGMIADVAIGVALTHTFIGDLTIDVEHGGATVRVYNRDCGADEDMDLVFDDAGAALNCDAPTSGAVTVPSEVLSAFDGAAAGGTWTFSVQDNANLDQGSVTEICVAVTF